jgi:two-component system, OmpR family, osmolarity sensor histidine kinase EnvZ
MLNALRRLPFFWRTLIFLLLLIATSALAFWQSFRTLDLEPRARQLSAQVIAIVNLTRSALIYSDAIARQALISDLNSHERVQVYPLEDNDLTESLPTTQFAQLFSAHIRQTLGPKTRIANAVNGRAGLWVSFQIEEDDYWLRVERERIERNPGLQWMIWGAVALLLSIAGAVLISRAISNPLRKLARAAQQVASGTKPQPLSETASGEVAQVNRSFNQMVSSLAKVDEERAVMLAGVSHDLRTPITRMRLELEMSSLSNESRSGMESDLAQMEGIVNQFMDLARPGTARQEPIDLAKIASAVTARYGNETRGVVQSRSPTASFSAPAVGDAAAIDRALTNLIENSLRYGAAQDGRAHVAVEVGRGESIVWANVQDNGAGVAAEKLAGLTKPFVRGEAARTDASGAGLGLAIVDRIARQHGGRLRLASSPGEGFSATIELPLRQVN